MPLNEHCSEHDGVAARPRTSYTGGGRAVFAHTMGRVVDPENTGKLYGPLQEKEPYAGVKVTRDVRYGKDERNVVDIFVPESGAAGRPVLMFVHGGGMIRGTKHAAGQPLL